MANIIDILVYFFIFFVIPMNIYLKKTGQTFPEVVKRFIEWIKELTGG